MSYIPHTTRLTYASLKFPAPENLSPRTRAVIRHRYDNLRVEIRVEIAGLLDSMDTAEPHTTLRTLCAEATDLQRLLGIYVPSKHNA